MTIVGLTGSVGMGKTTTTKLFEEAGAIVWSADEAVHRLYKAHGAGAMAIAQLEPRALTPTGAVDRTKLRKYTQESAPLLAKVEAIIHPLVKVDREQFIAAARAAGAEVVVLEIPLLFETDGEDAVDVVVVVTAPATVQKTRVLDREGMDNAAFEWIKSRQLSDAEKCARADYIVMTNDGIDYARTQVQAILRELSQSQQTRRTPYA